jgi:hypothetical protein
MLSLKDTGFLLAALCERYGLCLPPEDRLRIIEQAPTDAVSFTEAFFASEGLVVRAGKRAFYSEALALAEEAFGERRDPDA